MTRKVYQHKILAFMALIICVLFISIYIYKTKPDDYFKQTFILRLVEESPSINILSSSPKALHRVQDCNHYNCFNIYKCGQSDNSISVYIYPIVKFVDEEGIPITLPHSKEFAEVLQTIASSKYYTSDPGSACFLVPSLDLLNQEYVRLGPTAQVLAALPYWNNGTNHILFNMLPGMPPTYSPILEVQSGYAINVGASFSTWTYRGSFDISIPVFNPYLAPASQGECNKPSSSRKWLLVSAQTNIHSSFHQTLEELALDHTNMLVVGKCLEEETKHSPLHMQRCRHGHTYKYPDLFSDSKFCLVIRGGRLGQMALSDSLMSGCIPVIVSNSYVMPLSEVLDWKRAAIFFAEEELGEIMNYLLTLSEERIEEMRLQGCFFWDHYFNSMASITNAVLQILNDRIFPHTARSYSEWNDPPSMKRIHPPLFRPQVAPSTPGFTAVILTYDRLESLFQVIQKVVQAPSLAKVLVVWNNQNKNPPPASSWPAISKPLKVVQTRENKLSNRFYPYDEIETDAILAMDDDIIMLTADEIEFGFEVWREHPDRIVGFPSRVHLWDNTTGRWRYESEWTNDISMVLTGAAFYHKYYSYLYTTAMPAEIRDWVDRHMNCEDIAMNFLVANLTGGKAPVKVTPRKKFKCPECVNVETLSADQAHMAERSRCINYFSQVYGAMPLRTVEFRADPVLYKDNFPEKIKWFNNVGSL